MKPARVCAKRRKFCASRIAQSCDVFGALPQAAELDAVVARAMPHQ